jgi:hypothetical protein
VQKTLEYIVGKQIEWALSRKIKINSKGYTLRVEDNLFRPLSTNTFNDFTSGKGNELGSPNAVGKMQALHSSAALAVNVFEYWRERDTGTIAELCGDAEGRSWRMRFEATHPNALGRIPSHLDVELSGPLGSFPIAIESKFTETYYRHTQRVLAQSYVNTPGLWKGLPGCEKLVHRIRDENQKQTSFEYLDAPQLLKHILGLATSFGPKGFILLYLWYGYDSPEAQQHWQEITEFESVIKDDINFRVMTYQELYTSMSKTPGISREYLDYLKIRYFSEPYNSLQDRMIAAEAKYGVLAGDMKKMEKRRQMHDKMLSKSSEK